ncbi:hypothetical protein [Streptomyces vinaceus]|uniref:hypothetical protein n=1 Tax=Streptomyces vinaceus TaxID=1960 RepID=UPI00369A4071
MTKAVLFLDKVEFAHWARLRLAPYTEPETLEAADLEVVQISVKAGINAEAQQR